MQYHQSRNLTDLHLSTFLTGLQTLRRQERTITRAPSTGLITTWLLNKYLSIGYMAEWMHVHVVDMSVSLAGLGIPQGQEWHLISLNNTSPSHFPHWVLGKYSINICWNEIKWIFAGWVSWVWKQFLSFSHIAKHSTCVQLWISTKLAILNQWTGEVPKVHLQVCLALRMHSPMETMS